MLIIKWIILFSIFSISTTLGISFANKYKYRVEDLKTIKNALNILKTKMMYTYEPLPQIFLGISKEFNGNIRQNF